MALTTPKQVLHDIKAGYIAATGDTDTITYGNIASKCNAAYGGGGGTDWGDTITDDWDTIIANANAGTVSGYSIGDTKTVEFVCNGTPLAFQFMIVDKNHYTISGTQNKAALTFMLKWLQLSYRMNDVSATGNTGGWMAENGDIYSTSLDETSGELVHGCTGRKILWTLYKGFPSNLQNAVKTVDVLYDDTNGIQTCKDKFFLPSSEELGATPSTNYKTGQGTLLSYFTSAAARKLTGICTPSYMCRSRRTDNTYFYGINSKSGASGSVNATSFASFCPIFNL